MNKKIKEDICLEKEFKDMGYKTLCFPSSEKGYEIKRPYMVMELSEVKKILDKLDASVEESV